jgi:2-C-methyl-D-erythritol 4-phosphate cytidylyltransferase/2-C-methyl-D-erythritol 2,4-cyclodiphosphate synthase
MNFKITFPGDMNKARMLVAGATETRTGFGYDIHPLRPGRPLVLGGVRIPFALGLYGHSDGDLICHAVSDALLGAAGLPDIGTLFPSSDPEFKDACSLELLKKALDRIREKGFLPYTVDIVISTQVPKLGPWIESIEASLKKTLFSDRPGTLKVKAKSGENLGEIGHGEAMVCWAIVAIKTAPAFSQGEMAYQ